mgnify:CR=1 FL=1
MILERLFACPAVSILLVLLMANERILYFQLVKPIRLLNEQANRVATGDDNIAILYKQKRLLKTYVKDTYLD